MDYYQQEWGTATKLQEIHIESDMSNEKTRPTFHSTDWFIGILIVAYFNPYITV